jgi:hypothetical protein
MPHAELKVTAKITSADDSEETAITGERHCYTAAAE